jgi:hypothetical protein
MESASLAVDHPDDDDLRAHGCSCRGGDRLKSLGKARRGRDVRGPVRERSQCFGASLERRETETLRMTRLRDHDPTRSQYGEAARPGQ